MELRCRIHAPQKNSSEEPKTYQLRRILSTNSDERQARAAGADVMETFSDARTGGPIADRR
jgi:hypothetical protein